MQQALAEATRSAWAGPGEMGVRPPQQQLLQGPAASSQQQQQQQAGQRPSQMPTQLMSGLHQPQRQMHPTSLAPTQQIDGFARQEQQRQAQAAPPLSGPAQPLQQHNGNVSQGPQRRSRLVLPKPPSQANAALLPAQQSAQVAAVPSDFAFVEPMQQQQQQPQCQVQPAVHLSQPGAAPMAPQRVQPEPPIAAGGGVAAGTDDDPICLIDDDAAGGLADVKMEPAVDGAVWEAPAGAQADVVEPIAAVARPCIACLLQAVTHVAFQAPCRRHGAGCAPGALGAGFLWG